MTTHIHLALQAGDIALSRGMQNLSFRYTRWINWREKRTGHLFQGRYKAILVDGDSYLLELARYIYLNPVWAGDGPEPRGIPLEWPQDLHRQGISTLADHRLDAWPVREIGRKGTSGVPGIRSRWVG
jgi:hypothetical protein